MNTELLKPLIEDAVTAAKKQAIIELKKLNKDEVKKLVDAELSRVIYPLEHDADTTASWWVKIRNRFYVLILNNSADTIGDIIMYKIK